MNRKRLLTNLFFVLGAGAATSLLGLVVSSLGPGARERADIVTVKLSSIGAGQVKLVGNSLPVYVVSQTDEILRDLDVLSDHVWNRTISTEYQASNGEKFFIFYGVSKGTRSCVPKLHRKEHPNEYRTDNATWLGGFWDMCRDLSYDYAGRTIKDPRYAYINFSDHAPNLPPVPGVSDDGVNLSFYAGRPSMGQGAR